MVIYATINRENNNKKKRIKGEISRNFLEIDQECDLKKRERREGTTVRGTRGNVKQHWAAKHIAVSLGKGKKRSCWTNSAFLGRSRRQVENNYSKVFGRTTRASSSKV